MPTGRDALLALPGIGRYTAGAVASIAYGERSAAVDGNVERVLSRYYAEAGRAWPRAEALIGVTADPSLHNQALMELGATVCTPRNPRCDACPIATDCAGRGEPERWPPRAARRPLPRREVCAGVLWDGDRFLVTRRPAEGLLGGLWDLPGAAREGREPREKACQRALRDLTGAEATVGRKVGEVEHVFTHFRMTLFAYVCTPAGASPRESGTVRWIEPGGRSALAFPQATRRLFEQLFADPTGSG
jgi:A/G-specific adenine glycosylase